MSSFDAPNSSLMGSPSNKRTEIQNKEVSIRVGWHHDLMLSTVASSKEILPK